MDIKFPTQKDPFPKVFAKAIITVIITFCIGLFLGKALSGLIGTDQTMVNTTTYTDNMAAVKQLFTDADQADSYMDTALNMLDMNGLRLYSSKNHDKMLAYYQGEYMDSSELFDEDVQLSLIEMMNTEDALFGVETTAGDAIEGVRLWNIAVEDNVVYYYLYYDEAGYIGIAYDHNENVIGNDNGNAMALTSNEDGDTGMWYLMYYLDD